MEYFFFFFFNLNWEWENTDSYRKKHKIMLKNWNAAHNFIIWTTSNSFLLFFVYVCVCVCMMFVCTCVCKKFFSLTLDNIIVVYLKRLNVQLKFTACLKYLDKNRFTSYMSLNNTIFFLLIMLNWPHVSSFVSFSFNFKFVFVFLYVCTCVCMYPTLKKRWKSSLKLFWSSSC